MSKALKVDLVLVCDDVRREANGKLIIIGVYNKIIGVPQFPATLILSLVMRLQVTEAVKSDIEFRCLADGQPKAETKGHIEISEAGPSMFHVPSLPIVDIGSECDLKFQWKLGPKGKWQTIYSIPIVAHKK